VRHIRLKNDVAHCGLRDVKWVVGGDGWMVLDETTCDACRTRVARATVKSIETRDRRIARNARKRKRKCRSR
jgi:hypothetical protein